MAAAFKTAKQRHLAALLSVKPLSLSEIRNSIGGDKSTVKRGLEALQRAGLVEYIDSGEGPTGPGRPAGMWALTTAGRAAAAKAIGSPAAASGPDDLPEAAPGILTRGATWVRATAANAQRRSLEAALAEGDLVAAASWIARLDGSGHEYVFMFESSVGEQPAENLVEALMDMDIRTTSGLVRYVRSPADFLELLRTARRGTPENAIRDGN